MCMFVDCGVPDCREHLVRFLEMSVFENRVFRCYNKIFGCLNRKKKHQTFCLFHVVSICVESMCRAVVVAVNNIVWHA